MKPIFNIFIFIFSVLQSTGIPLSKNSKKSNYPKLPLKRELGFSSFSTFSIGVLVWIGWRKRYSPAFPVTGSSHPAFPLVMGLYKGVVW